jgi:hypothetical protein
MPARKRSQERLLSALDDEDQVPRENAECVNIRVEVSQPRI